jgi:hypothetical protein
MSVLIKLGTSRQLFIERDRWSTPQRWLEWHVQGREILIWIGRWHLIYTPAHWMSAPGPFRNGRVA